MLGNEHRRVPAVRLSDSRGALSMVKKLSHSPEGADSSL